MGDSLPPPAEFDLVDSFARLRGTEAEIVLAEPKTEIADDGVSVRLQQGGQSLDAPAEATDSGLGRRLVVRVPRNRLTDGTWSLAVVRPDGSIAPLAARLLVQGARPLVLLWGAKAGKTQEPAGRPNDPKIRAARAGARVLDRALTPLPADKAKQIRRQARQLARKILK
jgi:hypothetical protein